MKAPPAGKMHALMNAPKKERQHFARGDLSPDGERKISNRDCRLPNPEVADDRLSAVRNHR